jgi:hypothetical protein
MGRTKWMRLGVRDAADVLRWAGEQNARRLDDFRYRVIRGREVISFRMVPRYAIEIGTADIIVVAHVVDGRRQRLMAALSALGRHAAQKANAAIAALRPRMPLPASVTAELYQFAPVRRSAPSRR